MYPPTGVHATSNTQNKTLRSCPLQPADPSVLSGPGDLSNPGPSSEVEDRFAHLKLAHSDSERAQKLKALPCCEAIKDVALETIEHWGKSFELTEQELFFEDLEPVEALKKKTNSELIQTQFEALAAFSNGVKSCFEEFQDLRKPFDDLVSAKDTTVTQQVEVAIKLHEGLKQNVKKLGLNADIILASDHDIWEFQATSVKETLGKIDSVLSAEHDHQEDIQSTLDLLKDGERIAPKVKEPSGLVAASLEGALKYGFLKLTKRHRNKLLESTMLQDTYQGEKTKADALVQKLEDSRKSLYKAHEISSAVLDKSFYTNTLVVVDEVSRGDENASFVAVVRHLDETEGKLLTLVELIENFFAQITQEYGQKFSTREVKRICSRVPNIFTALEMLLSAKEIVVDDHQHIYEEHIYELSQTILEHFDNMKEVYWERRVATTAVERQEAFLRDDVPKFESVISLLDAIKDIAKNRISKSKSEKACDKRAKDDRYHRNATLTRPGRPLVTGTEILWVTEKVIDALLLLQMVSRVSNACDKSTGKIVSGREERATTSNGTKNTVASRTLEWFRMPDEMIDQFYAVLFGEAKKLHFLKGSRERQTDRRKCSNEEPGEPGGRFSRLRRLMSHKLH